MDRTTELFSVASIYDPNIVQTNEQLRPVSYILGIASKISGFVEDNENSVKRLEKLSSQREFSNNPTKAIEEITEVFHLNVETIHQQLERLKKETNSGASGKQNAQHWDLIVTAIAKTIRSHVAQFQKLLKVHSDHVENRKQRVYKYGQGLEQKSSSGLGEAEQYAIFSSANEVHIAKSQDLRSRKVVASKEAAPEVSAGHSESLKSNDDEDKYKKNTSRSFFNGFPSSSAVRPIPPFVVANSGQQLQQQQEQKSKMANDARLRNAEKVESAITTMGQLFSQMANLVAEQSEVITRIEDDVEMGLVDTQEGHKSMQKVLEITKGNRGLIIKVFLLLVFFIFLFLKWT